MCTAVCTLLYRHIGQIVCESPNSKRAYRGMKAHGLFFRRHSGKGDKGRHDGGVAVDWPNYLVLGRVRDCLR